MSAATETLREEELLTSCHAYSIPEQISPKSQEVAAAMVTVSKCQSKQRRLCKRRDSNAGGNILCTFYSSAKSDQELYICMYFSRI